MLFACEEEIEIIPEATIKFSTSRFLESYPITFLAEIPEGAQIDDFEYTWDFGDGNSGTGIEIEHTYELPGTYDLRLTVTGKTDSRFDDRTIEVKPSLELIGSYALNVDEPSGLSFGLNHETLWTVSDRTGRVYQMDLSGNNIRTLNYFGGDLEGISFDQRDSTLWIVDESAATLIHLDTNGVVLGSQWIAGVSDGSGLEGISIDHNNSRIFLIKEKDNSALLVLDDSLKTTSYKRIGFAPDYSGLYYSNSSEQLWMLSHEASSVYLSDTLGNLIETYGFDLAQPEGIVFNEIDRVFYIVDDTSEKLYKFQFWE